MQTKKSQTRAWGGWGERARVRIKQVYVLTWGPVIEGGGVRTGCSGSEPRRAGRVWAGGCLMPMRGWLLEAEVDAAVSTVGEGGGGGGWSGWV